MFALSFSATFTPGFIDQASSYDDFDPDVIQSCIVNQTDCPGLTYFPQNNFSKFNTYINIVFDIFVIL